MLFKYGTIITRLHRMCCTRNSDACLAQIKRELTSKVQVLQNTVYKDKTPKYGPLIKEFIKNDEPTSHYSRIIEAECHTQTLQLLHEEMKRINSISHAKQRKERAGRINLNIRKRSKAIESGKLRQPINSILGRAPRQGFLPAVDTTDRVYIAPGKGHQITTRHWTKHMQGTTRWAKATGFNEDTPQADLLRRRVLAGTLTSADRQLLNRALTPAERELMPDLLKFMQRKSNPAVMAEIAAALAKPITQQELFFKIHHRLGGKSPGPSGVTLDILKIIPETWATA